MASGGLDPKDTVELNNMTKLKTKTDRQIHKKTLKNKKANKQCRLQPSISISFLSVPPEFPHLPQWMQHSAPPTAYPHCARAASLHRPRGCRARCRSELLPPCRPEPCGFKRLHTSALGGWSQERKTQARRCTVPTADDVGAAASGGVSSAGARVSC